MATPRTRKTRKKTSKPKAETTNEMAVSQEVWTAIQQFRARSDHFVAEIGRHR